MHFLCEPMEALPNGAEAIAAPRVTKAEGLAHRPSRALLNKDPDLSQTYSTVSSSGHIPDAHVPVTCDHGRTCPKW